MIMNVRYCVIGACTQIQCLSKNTEIFYFLLKKCIHM